MAKLQFDKVAIAAMIQDVKLQFDKVSIAMIPDGEIHSSLLTN
jgi:hypothetical protein